MGHPRTKAQPIPAAKRQKTGSDDNGCVSGSGFSSSLQESNHHVTETKPSSSLDYNSINGSPPIERLLEESPSYTRNCELYPRALRDTINQHSEEIVVTRDPKVTAKAERGYREKVRKEKRFMAENPKEALSVYPGMSRYKDDQ
ncbi:hypothetical protein GGI07_003856 [Coemansia sp. Benny D115]|nr:hypothetical protein GGI07_003856 [Coemansia sp. Benny D115]